jgi:hypothetical protein
MKLYLFYTLHLLYITCLINANKYCLQIYAQRFSKAWLLVPQRLLQIAFFIIERIPGDFFPYYMLLKEKL